MTLPGEVWGWLAWLGATSPIWGAFLWELWEGGIRPRLIPASAIDALAASMLARHGDRAEETAFVEEDRAWRYSESFEQGKWRRVRKRIVEIPLRCQDRLRSKTP